MPLKNTIHGQLESNADSQPLQQQARAGYVLRYVLKQETDQTLGTRDPGTPRCTDRTGTLKYTDNPGTLRHTKVHREPRHTENSGTPMMERD